MLFGDGDGDGDAEIEDGLVMMTYLLVRVPPRFAAVLYECFCYFSALLTSFFSCVRKTCKR